MIKKICDLTKSENHYILQPRRDGMIQSYHHSKNYNINHIFDLRSQISEKNIDGPLHFYLLLFNKKMQEIKLCFLNLISCRMFTMNLLQETLLEN